MLRRVLILSIFSIVCVANFASDLAAQYVSVTTVDGTSAVGKVVEWTSHVVKLETSDSLVKIAADDLLEVRLQEAVAKARDFQPIVEFVDGSQISMRTITVNDRIAAIFTPLAEQPIKLPADQIRLVQFSGIKSAGQLPPANVAGDFLVVSKKDSEETETLEGIINSVAPEQVEFNWDGETIPVKRSKIAALGFYRAKQSDVVEPICWLTLVGGGKIGVREMRIDDDKLIVATTSDMRFDLPLDAIETADYSVGKLIYLSDVEPISSQWTPLVGFPSTVESIQGFGAPRQNISFTGSALSLSWPDGDQGKSSTIKTYNKGLAVRSRTILDYRLPRGMRRFVTIAGIDPETLSQGQVRLSIEFDGENVFDQVIDGKQPVEIDLNVQDRQRMKIVVDYDENLDFGDRVHLVEARLIK